MQQDVPLFEITKTTGISYSFVFYNVLEHVILSVYLIFSISCTLLRYNLTTKQQ